MLLKITAPMPRALLELLEAQYLRLKGVREMSVSYDYRLKELRLDLIPPEGLKARRLQVDCHEADQFKATRKKGSKRGRVTRALWLAGGKR